MDRDAERERQAAAARAAAAKKAAAGTSERGRAEGKKEKPRNPWRLQEVESAIMKLEEERGKLMAALGEERVWRDATAMRETQSRLAEVERDLQEKNQEWERMI
jgi:hypothetical protein